MVTPFIPIYSQQRDRKELSNLMSIWVRNKSKWREFPLSEIDIDGIHFSIKDEHDHQYLRIKCGKYEWVEDYFPSYTSVQFGVNHG